MRKAVLLNVLVAAILVACSSGGDSRRAQPADIAAWTGELPISDPWLREQLPSGTLTYERIPHPLGLLAIPKGNSFDTALGSATNIQNLIDIQEGLARNLGADVPPVGLLQSLRSPIEVAVVGMPLPSALIAATSSFRSNVDFEAFMAELGQFVPVSLAGPLDAAGFGRLVGAPPPVQIQVHFDAATGRLALYAGMSADPATFASLLEPRAGNPEHPMHALEAQIDDSGQGLFAWVDTAQALQAGAMFLPPGVAQTLSATGANQVRALAAGTGVANGKGRLKLVADLGTGSAGRPIPVIANDITATSVGDLRSLFLFSMPDAGEFTRLENMVLGNLPPEAQSAWGEAKTTFAERTGTSIEEILSALGPELIVFSDRAGDFFGLHVRDEALLDNVLDRWVTNVGVPIESRSVGGETIRYWELPAAFGMPEEMRQQAPAAVAGVLGRMRNRLYWVEDGSYLYLGGTPQVLIDRIDMGADASIAEWLDETQRIDLSSSLLAATGTTERLPRMMYNAYVRFMQTIADLVGAEYDVWAMPTAAQLGLPERGSVGITVNLGEPYVSLEMSYESHPFEVLIGGGGMAAVAGIGIVAAVAIPAYQDYTIRAQVTEGLNLAAIAKAAVAEAYSATGEIPSDSAAAGLADIGGRYVASVDIVGGNVVVRYGNAAHQSIAARALVIAPYASGSGDLTWICGYFDPPPGLEPLGGDVPGGTTVMTEHLPSACR